MKTIKPKEVMILRKYNKYISEAMENIQAKYIKVDLLPGEEDYIKEIKENERIHTYIQGDKWRKDYYVVGSQYMRLYKRECSNGFKSLIELLDDNSAIIRDYNNDVMSGLIIIEDVCPEKGSISLANSNVVIRLTIDKLIIGK